MGDPPIPAAINILTFLTIVIVEHSSCSDRADRAWTKASIVGFQAKLYPVIASQRVAMTCEIEHTSAFLRRDPPEVCKNLVPLQTEGAGKAGCPMHPQPRV
jgi:hypothetical protein